MTVVNSGTEKPAKSVRLDAKGQTGKTWGRDKDISWFTAISSLFIMIFCPFFAFYSWMACTHYQCEILGPFQGITQDLTQDGILKFLEAKLPHPTPEGLQIYFSWLLFQAVLYAILPSKIGYGQQTPAGFVLPYKVNGLLAWFVTHAIFLLGAYYFEWWNPAIIHDNWGALLIAANIYGYFLTLFAFAKAYIAPSHPEDRKFSGSIIYDMFMGIEFNPRFGKLWDFKLFHNGRPGIIAWTLINLSFAAAQYREIGYVTNSMILVNFLHAVYVLDFFYNEDWYLRTIDICHDHFGFYLAWGDTVWLPWMYTLQSHYLVRNPVDLPTPFFASVLGMGLLGYYIFRAVNNEKDLVRRMDGKCMLWGKPAKFVRAKYSTSDGMEHTSILIASGYWGIARQFNYVGDLLISFAMCLACGVGHLLPYFYIIYMAILLLHRIGRSDHRCRAKYGPAWDEYCRLVPYKLIPYIY